MTKRKPKFRTLPKDQRPYALVMAALRTTKIGPIFPEPGPDSSMRGVVRRATKRPFELIRERRNRRRAHRRG